MSTPNLEQIAANTAEAAWNDIGPNEQWEHDASLPNVKDQPRPESGR